MPQTSNMFALMEPEIKEQAEPVLDRLGIPMSNAVGMTPLSYGSLTKEQFDAEMEKGMADVKAGRVYSTDAIEAEMKRDFDDSFP